jgi:hypothetical protein
MRAVLLRIALLGGLGATLVAAPGPAPTVHVLTPPDFWGSYAIWGSVGVDPKGHVWMGMTTQDERAGSAHLYEYDPAADAFEDRGDVLDELKRLGLARPGERQMKIHSRIVYGADGYQYFASMDESGEADDGSKLPVWGGHLWRRGPTGAWEHLLATREALFAVASGGPFIYTVGYFNHVLYQFDTRTKKVQSVTVGAAGGHVSRNFFADDRGHAFVTRITYARPAPPQARLVEYDADLKEVGVSPLREYFDRDVMESHGIVAIHPDGHGGWFFTTSRGRLYQEQPSETGPATVTDLGWFSPNGARYIASMFRDETTGMLYGAAMPDGDGALAPEWITRIPGGEGTIAPLPYGTAPQFPHGALLYGSMARDPQGRMYVVGSMNFKPLVLQITPAK